MLAQGLWRFDLGYFTTWQALVVGTLVASFVFVILRRLASRRRRRRAAFSTEEDLPWEELLEQLRARERELAASGAAPETDLPSEELLGLLLSRLPAGSARRSL